MRRLVVLAACATTLACAPGQPKPVTTLKDNNEKVSYILGLQMGKSLKEQGVTLIPTFVVPCTTGHLRSSAMVVSVCVPLFPFRKMIQLRRHRRTAPSPRVAATPAARG